MHQHDDGELARQVRAEIDNRIMAIDNTDQPGPDRSICCRRKKLLCTDLCERASIIKRHCHRIHQPPTFIQINENGAYILLYDPKHAAYIHAAAHEETVNKAEGEDRAGTRSRQQQIAEWKERTLRGPVG